MWLRTFALSTILLFIGFTQANAKSYEIPTIRVEVSIYADGTVKITEHLTYIFDGSYSWAEYELPKQGFSAISDIRISKNSQSYINSNV